MTWNNRETGKKKRLKDGKLLVFFSHKHLGWCIFKRVRIVEIEFVNGPFLSEVEARDELKRMENE